MTDITRKKIVKWFWIIISAPVLLLLAMILLVWAFADIPSFEELENPESKLATEIIADDGQILTTFHIENRSYPTTNFRHILFRRRWQPRTEGSTTIPALISRVSEGCS